MAPYHRGHFFAPATLKSFHLEPDTIGFFPLGAFGLRRRYLHKHRADVRRFFRSVLSRQFLSEAAQKLQARLQKYEWRFFTFLDYDDVPWNNQYAEHAIKCFARYRRFADGRFTEASIGEYLVMLSIFQTCEYRGINFLEFLLSEKRDIEAFACDRMRLGGQLQNS